MTSRSDLSGFHPCTFVPYPDADRPYPPEEVELIRRAAAALPGVREQARRKGDTGPAHHLDEAQRHLDAAVALLGAAP